MRIALIFSLPTIGAMRPGDAVQALPARTAPRRPLGVAAMAVERKPFRRSRNRIIAGVCAGVAEWLDWRPEAGRILFMLLALMSIGVPALVIYLVLWTIMPPPE